MNELSVLYVSSVKGSSKLCRKSCDFCECWISSAFDIFGLSVESDSEVEYGKWFS
ncbi:uncharacterized protein DS421_11g323180 [Arachis hypogaea]|nr:uncharacterized protein DS421_11g323180 [Arachis hypogaea]